MQDITVGDDEEKQATLAHKAQLAEAALVADGRATTEGVQDDYFGFDEVLQIILPDGKSVIEHKVMNEGQRTQYLNAINRDVRVQKATGDLVTRLRPGDERRELLKAAIVGWNLVRKNTKTGVVEPVGFTQQTCDQWLKAASPKIVDLVEKEVRKANAWLLADLSVEDIDKEIAELYELREKKVEEEAGNAASSSK